MKMRTGLAFLATAFLTVPVRAADLPEPFTLGRYVPDDVFLYIHGVHNPQRDWLDAEWAEVFDALMSSGIDRDAIKFLRLVFTEAFDFAPDDEAPIDVEATVEKWTALLGAVRWNELVRKEVVFAERFTPGRRGMPDYFFLARGAPDSAERNAAALVAILREFAELRENFALSSTETDGMTLWQFELKTREGAPDFGLTLWRKDDVIAAVVGSEARRDVLALFAGKPRRPPITASPRLKEALTLVPPPKDMLTFIDARAMFGVLQHTFTGLLKSKTEAAARGDEDCDLRSLRTIRTLLAELNVFDFVISSVETKGRQTTFHEVTRLQSGKEESALARALYDRKTFERFDRYVPATATSFRLSGLINLEALYTSIIDFLEKEVPDGSRFVEKFKERLSDFGFDPQRDFLSWWSGEMIYVVLPPAFVSPMSSSDWVVMFRVKDAERAAEKVNAAIDRLNGFLAARGQTLLITPADVGADGFREVTHPMLAMVARPVIGVKDNWLMIGSSAAAARKSLAVAAGKEPSIRENPRFKEEGLIPTGAVLGASFKNTSRWGQEMAQATAMVGMVGGMMSAGISGEGAEKKKELLQTIMGAVAKLGPVFLKMDFYSSESSVTTREAEGTFRCVKVVTYKKPEQKDTDTVGAN